MSFPAIDLNEYKNALIDGLGIKSDRFSIIHIAELSPYAGVAYSIETHTLWVLIDDTNKTHKIDSKALFLAEVALVLTKFFHTLVVPAQTSRCAETLWSGKKRGPFLAYQFSLADTPNNLYFSK